jgi:hypothetical protein
VVALMAVEDQQAITTHSSGPSILLEMPNLIHAFLICCPTILSNSDYPVRWKSAILVPRCKVIFPCNNDKRRHYPALGINTLDYCNLFPIARLYLFCLYTPV